METRRHKHELRNRIAIGALGTLAIVGGVHVVEHAQAQNSVTNEAISGMPNFHGESANQFLAKSPSTREALKNGTLVEITADNIPLREKGIEQPNTLDNIAWDITPKGGDVNQVVDELQNLQNSHAQPGVIDPGQEFIVDVTPASAQLAKAEAKQGIY